MSIFTWARLIPHTRGVYVGWAAHRSATFENRTHYSLTGLEPNCLTVWVTPISSIKLTCLTFLMKNFHRQLSISLRRRKRLVTHKYAPYKPPSDRRHYMISQLLMLTYCAKFHGRTGIWMDTKRPDGAMWATFGSRRGDCTFLAEDTAWWTCRQRRRQPLVIWPLSGLHHWTCIL